MKFINESVNSEPLVRAHETDAGTDIKSNESVIIYPNERAIVGTGVRIIGEIGKYVRIADRSGLAAKKGIHIFAGVVDPGYTGEVKVVVFNSGDRPFEIDIGMRIAQFIIEQYSPEEFVNNDTFEIIETDRGTNGFNSSGLM